MRYLAKQMPFSKLQEKGHHIHMNADGNFWGFTSLSYSSTATEN